MNILIFSTALPAKANEWNRIATTGEWKGYRDTGATLSAQDLESCVAFHDEINAPGSKVVVDYDHSTLRVLAGTLDPKLADAAGWIQELQLRQGEKGPELWQRQTWTQAAAAKIEAGERGYLSPVILTETKHPITGKPVRAMLHSVGLTNTPFFRHLGGVATLAGSDLAELLDGPQTRARAFEGFAVDYLLGKSKPLAEVEPFAQELTASIEALDDLRRVGHAAGLALVLGRKEDGPWNVAECRFDAAQWTPERARKWLAEHKLQGRILTATQEANQVDRKELAKLLGLAEDATEEAIKAKIAANVQAAAAKPPIVASEVATLLGVAPEADLAAVTAAVEGLKAHDKGNSPQAVAIVAVATALGLPAEADAPAILARIGELGGRIEGSTAEALVDEAIRKRQIPPANKGWWVEQAKGDFAGVKAIIGSMPPIIGAASAGVAPKGDDLPELSEQDRQLTEMCGNDPMAVRKTKAARAKGA